MNNLVLMDITDLNMKDHIKRGVIDKQGCVGFDLAKSSEGIEVNYNYISNLLLYFCEGLDGEWINVENISKYIFRSIKRKMQLEDLYNYIADYSASKMSYHPDYNKLASKICIHILHSKTSEDFSTVINQLYNNIDKEGHRQQLITDDIYEIVKGNSDIIQKEINYERDYNFDYFAIKTLERSYLYKLHYIRNNNGLITKLNKIIERPQHMFMRVALGIHGNNLDKVFESYHLMSNKYFTHATPTLFNAGSTRPQMSSCFLLYMTDSIEGIFETITDIANISKWAGGIGLSLSDIRAKGSIIRKTNGMSDGIIPLCRVLNEEARYINQGGKRKGSIAVYLEIWHADIFDFCDLRKNKADESIKCRDLFTALWTCDLFMKRVERNDIWSLMCPDECPGLTSSYGDEFEKLYIDYEKQEKYKRQVNAVELWWYILESQIETGMPFMLYKDSANKKSNQKNLGTIKSSNLCVAPETKILTDEGYQIICEQENNKVKIWNGEQFNEVIIRKTGKNQKLLKITFSNGSILECTKNHKFYIQNNNNNEIPLIIEAKDLKIGMKIIKYNLPKIDGIDNISVISMVDEGRISDTYCFTEPLKHMGIFNGILTAQCTEIIEYTDEKTISVCNLASICLPKFIETDIYGKKEFNFDKLIEIAGVIVRNLDIIIDKNFYTSPKTLNSNLLHRPVGVGIMGLADLYNIMGYPFNSREARRLNELIFESIYYGCVVASNNLAKELGPYSSFKGSPSSEGKLQFHLWGLSSKNLSGRYDWDSLCASVKLFGLRNSLLTTIMPTATTSQIMGYSEAIDPYLSNVYTRQTLAGEFIIINGNLINDLIQENLWSEEMRKKIIVMNGSISKINNIPQHIKKNYRTAFEIKMKDILKQSIERGKFIDQSQSLNLYMETSDFDRLTSAHFYGWEKGLKTGMYYLRSKASVDPIQFGIDPKEIQRIKKESEEIQFKEECDDNNTCKIRPGVKISECSACS